MPTKAWRLIQQAAPTPSADAKNSDQVNSNINNTTTHPHEFQCPHVFHPPPHTPNHLNSELKPQYPAHQSYCRRQLLVLRIRPAVGLAGVDHGVIATKSKTYENWSVLGRLGSFLEAA